jgi:hypothetical protein
VAYAVVSELRALDGLADTGVYPDATLQQGIDFATELVDSYCGTSFEAKAFDVTVDGNGAGRLYVGVLHIRTITAVTFDGVAQTAADFVGRPDGVVASKAGLFPVALYGPNVRVQGTAGVTTTPGERIKWAARTIARQYALDLHSRIPSRALSVTNELGNFEVRAQAGGPGRPTNLPDVNAVLNSNKHKPGHMGQAVFT